MWIKQEISVDKTQKRRIAAISVGVIFVAIGISFITSFPAYIQYSDGLIISGMLGVIIGFVYPFPETTVKKPRMWYERAPSLEDSDGGKILLVGLIMIVSGLILGALEFFEGIPLIGVLIIVIFCGGGWVLFVAGAIIVTIDRFKKSRLFRKKVNFASDFTADLMLF